MKTKLTIAILSVITSTSFATGMPASGGDVINSNNTNVSTTNQANLSNAHNVTTTSNDYKDSYNQNYSGNDRNNVSGSYNQSNSAYTKQDIDNSSVKDSNNTYNENSGNTTTINRNGDEGTNAGGTIKNSSEGGASSANSTGGASDQQQQQKQQNTISTGANSYVSQSTNITRIPVNTPNLPAVIGMVSHNANACMNVVGGGASGGNGASSASFNFIFGSNDYNCEMWQRANFFIAMGNYTAACNIMYTFDKNERDGLYAKEIDNMGGCAAVTKTAVAVVAPVVTPSATALDTEHRLNQLGPINPAISRVFETQMRK